jgi:transposase
MDETVVRLGGLRRTMARTLRGTRAVCRDVTDYAGVAYSIILATDINVGVVAYFIIPGTINRERYLDFLQNALFPRLGASPRYLLMDNASSHHGSAILEACEAHGHVVLYRPAYSPHLAWIELQNSILKSELRRRYASLTHENIVDQIERILLECITAEKVRAAAVHCHYHVPDYPYQPWLGD